MRLRFSVQSIAQLTVAQVREVLSDRTGKAARSWQRTELPRRGYGRKGELEMVAAEELELLERAFTLRGWGPDTKRAFVRRQLRGREEIRTRADFHRVFSGVRAMNRRDGLSADRGRGNDSGSAH